MLNITNSYPGKEFISFGAMSDQLVRLIRKATIEGQTKPMLAHVATPELNVHRIPGEKPNAQEAAGAYESELRSFFGLANDELPRLDLVLLGMGADGHTASIFPGSEVLQEKRRLVAAPWIEKLQTYRITMTLPVLNNAANVLFLVSGDDKAATVNEVLNGKPGKFPAQSISPTNGSLTWCWTT